MSPLSGRCVRWLEYKVASTRLVRAACTNFGGSAVGVAATSSESVRGEVAELLGVSPDAVDPDADLIASGLDSIRMMSLSGRWRKQGIEVGFAALAANPMPCL